MRNKQVRQARIRELLHDEAVDTHEKLADILHLQGIEVSQSTLSKDLRELGVVRVPQAEGGFRYTLPESGATVRDRRSAEHPSDRTSAVCSSHPRSRTVAPHSGRG